MVGRPRKYKTVQEMQKAIDKYFEECDIEDTPYTVTGLALALDFDDRSSLIDYCNYIDEEGQEFSHTIKKAKAKVEKSIEEKMLNGKYNPTSGIFNLKNNFNWKDKQEIESKGEQKIVVEMAGDLAEWSK